MTDSSPLPRVLLFSSGNPAATFLAAGLLRGQPDRFGALVVQGVGAATAAPEVGRVLAEIGIELGGWAPPIVSAPPAAPVAIGLTICVPTCVT